MRYKVAKDNWLAAQVGWGSIMGQYKKLDPLNILLKKKLKIVVQELDELLFC